NGSKDIEARLRGVKSIARQDRIRLPQLLHDLEIWNRCGRRPFEFLLLDPSTGRSHGQGQIPLERSAAGAAPNQARDSRMGRQARTSRGWFARTGVALRALLGRRAIR